MPISFDRLHVMLTEHEELRRIASELYEIIKQTIKDRDNYPSDAAKLFDIEGQIERLNHLPGYAHALERQMYNRNVKRNKYARDYQRRARRKRGMTERQPVGSPHEIEAQLSADQEYYQAMGGQLPSEAPNRPMTQQEFLATLTPPTPKTEEQLAAETEALLNIKDEDSAPSAP